MDQAHEDLFEIEAVSISIVLRRPAKLERGKIARKVTAYKTTEEAFRTGWSPRTT